MKNTTATIMAICLMSFTMAYYPGETLIISNEMGLDNLVYVVVGNSSPVSPLDVTINSTNIIIIFPQDMTPDSFDIVFLENQSHEVVQVVYRGGGSSHTRYVDNNITVYVPEYINTIEEVEVEKVVERVIDKTSENENSFKLRHLILLGAAGLAFGAWAMNSWKKEDSEPTAEELMEEIEGDEKIN